MTEPGRATLWTILTEAALAVLEREGRLVSRVDLVDPDWLEAYRWMAHQMERRLEVTRGGATLPIWAWFQYDSARRPRPDLRRSGHLPSGTPGFLVEFEAPTGSYLLSDFEGWHSVLNRWYLAASDADDDRFHLERERRGLSRLDELHDDLPDDLHRERERSWERIFDLEARAWFADSLPLEERSIQATLWQLDRERICSIRSFTAR